MQESIKGQTDVLKNISMIQGARTGSTATSENT